MDCSDSGKLKALNGMDLKLNYHPSTYSRVQKISYKFRQPALPFGV